MATLPLNYDRDYRKVYRQVLEFFKEKRRTNIWMKAKNPLLGGLSPIEMLLTGKGDDLKEFVNGMVTTVRRR